MLIGGGATDAIATALAYSRGPQADNSQLYDVQFVSTAVAVLAFAYLCTAVRCPKCGAKWIWMGVNGKLSPKSLDTLVTLDHCPTCGHAAIPPP